MICKAASDPAISPYVDFKKDPAVVERLMFSNEKVDKFDDREPKVNMPLVLRVSVGSKYGAQHSQDWTALCAHIPGLKVCFPATPWEAKGLMESALRGTNPVVFFESQRIYDVGEQFHEGGVPEERYEIEFGDVKNNK